MLTLDRYLRYDELTDELHRLAATYPGLVQVDSIGRSHEGRDIWLATITDAATGPHDEKPAHWVDGNIHATEVTASVGALSVIDHLVTGFGTNARVTRALATRTFYVVPRVNPDGAELALSDSPRWLRSSTKVWPWAARFDAPGLRPHDIDGDGRVLSMRVPDPTGAWKAHPEEPRLMVPRGMADGPEDGPFWRLLWEGDIVDHDGYTVPTPSGPEGLDLNRNFPAGWARTLSTSGDFPGSEAETEALMRAINARSTICGYNAMHTYGGVLLRPSSTRPDTALPPFDVWAWSEIGQEGTALTGYAVHSVYEDFTWDRSVLISGAADDWLYEHKGVFAWTTEFWDAVRTATGSPSSTESWYFGPTVEQELAVLRWFDEHHPGYYIDWRPFEHPQLGPVEIGGWDQFRSWSNPPPGARLAAEVAPHGPFAVTHALASPCLSIGHAVATRLGADVWQVELGVHNDGWLPTQISAAAAKDGLVLPLVATVESAEGAIAVLGGSARQELGQLDGRSQARFTLGWANDGTPERTVARWTIRARGGTPITLVAAHPRAGTARRTLILPDGH